MDFENYMELYEAVYFFNKIYNCIGSEPTQLIYSTEVQNVGITESVHKAFMRILVVNNLLDYNEEKFILTIENKEKLNYIFDNEIKDNQKHEISKMFDKATVEGHFFFDSINELEYEIYSRFNFAITYKTGKEVANKINLENKKVLELGGNSGGLGSAILEKYTDCDYTIVDMNIPCMVGNEFAEMNEQNIHFVEDDIFKLNKLNEVYDYIIIMNLLHDFDDEKCLDILNNCKKYCDVNTKFIIIEDILENEIEPNDVVMHGLRLAVECRGGRQRTTLEFEKLFSSLNYKISKIDKISNVHTMLTFVAKDIN